MKFQSQIIVRAAFAVLLFSTGIAALNAQDNLRPGITNLIDKLKAEDQVHFGYPVGFAGTPETDNKFYKKYLKLKDKATNEELLVLTNHSSPAIVVYAFDILWRRKYAGLKNILSQHLNNTTFFWTAGGCTGVLDRVNWFMLRRLNPKFQESDTNYLTRGEYDAYCRLFKEQDKLFASD